MPARNTATSVASTATVIEGTQYPGWVLQNLGAASVFLGDLGVTTANGFSVPAGGYYSPGEFGHRKLTNDPADRLYGICVSGTQDVRVLVGGKNLNQ